MVKYEEVLDKSRSDMMLSEYTFKSNTMRRVIEIKGSELVSSYSRNSDIIVFYNIGTGLPMVLVERIPLSVLEVMPVKEDFDMAGFVVNVEQGGSEERSYVEIIVTQKDLYEALK